MTRLRRPSRSRATSRGLTLLEVLVSVGILAVVATLVYGALDGMSRARTAISRSSDRYHQGRAAMSRMARELQSAFVSAHQPLVVSQAVRNTAFIGKDSANRDRVDFTSFSHQRLGRDVHESDQNELSYFVSRDPDHDKVDLVRRESPFIDLEPGKGGVVSVLCEDIDTFELSYLDPITGEWTDTWDSSQPAAQLNRLPVQIKITLVLNGGVGGQPIRLVTKVPVAMQTAVSFAVPR